MHRFPRHDVPECGAEMQTPGLGWAQVSTRVCADLIGANPEVCELFDITLWPRAVRARKPQAEE